MVTKIPHAHIILIWLDWLPCGEPVLYREYLLTTRKGSCDGSKSVGTNKVIFACLWVVLFEAGNDPLLALFHLSSTEGHPLTTVN